MYKIVLSLIFIIFLSACSTSNVQITEYTINTKIQNTNANKNGCLNKSLKLSQAFSKNALMSSKMSYAEGVYKQYFYSQSQWADSPNRALTFEILKLIRTSQLFKNVHTFKSRAKNDLILETNIEDFMQYFTDDLTKSYVNVVISLTIIDAKSKSILATKTFGAKVDSKTLDAEGGVKALNEALEIVLSDVSEWLVGVCK